MESQKPDHDCPHWPDGTDGKDIPTGWELCRTCGDYRTCAICGEEYIFRDMQGPTCSECSAIAEIELQITTLQQRHMRMLAELEKRIQRYKK